MQQPRLILYIALMTVLFFLWQAWEKDYAQPPTTQTQETATTSSDLPPVSALQQAQTGNASATGDIPVSSAISAPTGEKISIQTDVIHATIDTQGANIVKLSLPQYPTALQTPDDPTVLFTNTTDYLYIAQSGLIGVDKSEGPDTQEKQAIFNTEKTEYTLTPDQNTLDVNFTWKNNEGITVTKTYTFKRGAYDVAVKYTVDNQTSKPWSGQFYAQLKQKPQPTNTSFLGLHTYNGGSLSTPDESYEKISFPDMEKKNLDLTAKGGWLAMQQRYFLSSWIADPTQTNHYYSRQQNGIYTLGFVGPKISANPQQQVSTNATLYAGPEDGSKLSDIAPNLNLTIDYGWLWPISIAIFWVMKHINTVVHNWGWSIVLVTLLIKLLFYRLSEKSYRSMAKMRKLTPKMQAIKERYGDDRQKMSQATMELYRKEKINPLSGCLPMLIQIPFFIALYYVLIESVELRQSPFIFWIHDLSARDPYYVLPILMGLSMYIQQKLSPAPPDPMQAKIMMAMPIVFTIFFLSFPAGLVLYWFVNSCLSGVQQWYVMHRQESEVLVKRH